MNEDDKKELAEYQREVLDELTDHPQYAVQIADKLQLTTGKVNNAILGLRSMGWPICGDDAYTGYYFGSLAEVGKTVENLKDSRRLIDQAIRFMSSMLSKKAEQLPGQEQMHI
ncbi:MAG: hypothetical protein IJ526_00475 [Lachnospiraceae bacterium]|nr:hypothetical protein [Lachnospiraceae bacterium]